jgi:triosephosphate isomerase
MDKLLIANWKENPGTEKEALALLRAVLKIKTKKDIQTVICPPFIYLEKCAGIAAAARGKDRPALGAQDVFWEDKGPYTGEVGPAMLKALGVQYVIIGHSERRQWLGETDAMINRKIRAALGAGLHIVLCVGESGEVRKKGVAAAQKFVKSQLDKDFKGISRATAGDKLIIAYEPIWAIGAGRPASPEDAVLMARFIKKSLVSKLRIAGLRVLYGGSVNSGNIADFVQYREVDGALVGGASLSAGEWKKMASPASE